MMSDLYRPALDDLGRVFSRIDHAAVDRAVDEIAKADKVALYGVGREGLQVKGFAMRLFHLGRKASVVGDMTTPHLGRGDLLIVSAGPGHLSTVEKATLPVMAALGGMVVPAAIYGLINAGGPGAHGWIGRRRRTRNELIR